MGASCSSSTAVPTRPSKSSEVRRSENALGKQIFVAPTNPDGTFMRPKFYLDRLVKGKVRWASVEDQTEPLTDEEILQVFEPIFAEGLLDRKATMSECTEDLVVRCIRGYVNNKPEVPKWVAAMEDMTPHAAAVGEGLEKIMAWRKRMQARTLLREHLEGAEKFYELWPFTCGGADDQGHLIFFERLREINYAEVLRTYTIDDILKYRAQAHELIQYWQLQEGHKQGRTIYKHLHVIDVGGITMRDFFKIKAVLQPIFKQTGDQYPNSLYRLFITNAPGIFQVRLTSRKRGRRKRRRRRRRRRKQCTALAHTPRNHRTRTTTPARFLVTSDHLENHLHMARPRDASQNKDSSPRPSQRTG